MLRAGPRIIQAKASEPWRTLDPCESKWKTLRREIPE